MKMKALKIKWKEEHCYNSEAVNLKNLFQNTTLNSSMLKNVHFDEITYLKIYNMKERNYYKR